MFVDASRMFLAAILTSASIFLALRRLRHQRRKTEALSANTRSSDHVVVDRFDHPGGVDLAPSLSVSTSRAAHARQLSALCRTGLRGISRRVPTGRRTKRAASDAVQEASLYGTRHGQSISTVGDPGEHRLCLCQPSARRLRTVRAGAAHARVVSSPTPAGPAGDDDVQTVEPPTAEHIACGGSEVRNQIRAVFAVSWFSDVCACRGRARTTARRDRRATDELGARPALGGSRRNPLRPCRRKTAPEQAATAKYIRPATPNERTSAERRRERAVYCTTLPPGLALPSGSLGERAIRREQTRFSGERDPPRKCGTCHRKDANRTNAGASMLPMTAVHPISGGMAPATAPTRSDAVRTPLQWPVYEGVNHEREGREQAGRGPTTT